MELEGDPEQNLQYKTITNDGQCEDRPLFLPSRLPSGRTSTSSQNDPWDHNARHMDPRDGKGTPSLLDDVIEVDGEEGIRIVGSEDGYLCGDLEASTWYDPSWKAKLDGSQASGGEDVPWSARCIDGTFRRNGKPVVGGAIESVRRKEEEKHAQEDIDFEKWIMDSVDIVD